MAVQKKKAEEIPAGAVILTENEVLEYQWKLMRNWTPTAEVWPFRFGLTILGTAASLAGIYMNSYYRKKLVLRDIGAISTYIPVAALPGVMSTVFHHVFVSNDVLVQKTTCPVCLQTRAAAIQSLCGAVYPVFLAPLTSFMIAIRYYTYNVPAIHKEPVALFNLWRKLTKPKGKIFFGIAVFQAVLGSAITYFEAKSYYNIQHKLLKEEEEIQERNAHTGVT